MASKKDHAAVFDGLNILSTTVSVKNTGDGLSKSMHVDPPALVHRQTVHVVLECEVVDAQTPIIKDTDGNELRYVLKAGRATVIDSKVALKALDESDKKIEKANGITRLPGIDGEEE